MKRATWMQINNKATVERNRTNDIQTQRNRKKHNLPRTNAPMYAEAIHSSPRNPIASVIIGVTYMASSVVSNRVCHGARHLIGDKHNSCDCLLMGSYSQNSKYKSNATRRTNPAHSKTTIQNYKRFSNQQCMPLKMPHFHI